MGWSDLVSSHDMFMMLHPYMVKTYFCLTFFCLLVSGSSMDQTPIEYLWGNDRKPTIVTHSSLPDACENDSWFVEGVMLMYMGIYLILTIGRLLLMTRLWRYGAYGNVQYILHRNKPLFIHKIHVCCVIWTLNMWPFFVAHPIGSEFPVETSNWYSWWSRNLATHFFPNIPSVGIINTRIYSCYIFLNSYLISSIRMIMCNCVISSSMGMVLVIFSFISHDWKKKVNKMSDETFLNVVTPPPPRSLT